MSRTKLSAPTDCRRAPALALVLAVALTNATPASAGDASPEHAQLATLARQLDRDAVGAVRDDDAQAAVARHLREIDVKSTSFHYEKFAASAD